MESVWKSDTQWIILVHLAHIGHDLLKKGLWLYKQLKVALQDHMEVQVCRWPGVQQPGLILPVLMDWLQLFPSEHNSTCWIVRLTVSDQRSYIVQQERMKETSANDLPWHLGQENLFLWNFAVQEKQHPDPWCLHINNASVSIRINKSHLSQRFKYWGSFYF